MCARSRTSARSEATPGSAARKDRPAEHVEQRRAEQEADENLAEHRRLVNPRRQRAGQLGRGDDQRQQQNDLQGMSQG